MGFLDTHPQLHEKQQQHRSNVELTKKTQHIAVAPTDELLAPSFMAGCVERE